MKWPMVELRHVANLRGGSTPRRSEAMYWGGDIPWLTPTDLPALGSGVVEVRETASAITKEGLDSCSASLLPPGTVLFSSRATIGKIGIAAVPLATNQGFANLIPCSGVDSRYLAWCMHFHAERISGLAGSTTFKEVSKSALKRFRVPLPPPSEQRRIVEILDQADALRKLRAEADAKAERILPALFIKMFGDPATNPMNWPTAPFRSLLTQKPRNGISPSTGGRVPGRVLMLSAITGARFDEAAVKDAFFAGPLRNEKFVDEQDFLICRGNGNIALVGRGRFPTRAMPETVFPDTIIAARIDPRKLDRRYLECLWDMASFRAKIRGVARTTSGIHKVNQRGIGNLEVLTPPVERQRLFGSHANTLATLPRDRSAAALGTLFSVLLHRAFEGSLTASWREAHMKELLQEMEQQAKALNGAEAAP